MRGDYAPLVVLDDYTTKDAISLCPSGDILKTRKSFVVFQNPLITTRTRHFPVKKERKRNVEDASISSQDRL